MVWETQPDVRVDRINIAKHFVKKPFPSKRERLFLITEYYCASSKGAKSILYKMSFFKISKGIVMAIDVLFFDVLGTVVDWRSSIAADISNFLNRVEANGVDPDALSKAWIARYDSSVALIRNDKRAFVTLDVINRENLMDCLLAFGLNPTNLPSDALDDLIAAWHRLRPWPDSVVGIAKLKKHFIVAPLSDGHTRLLVNLSRYSGLQWDMIFGADVSLAYKPMPQVYLRACDLLQVTPERAMLVAAHDYDLDAAQHCGLKAAYVPRRYEISSSTDQETPIDHRWDYIAHDLIHLAEILVK